MNEKRQDADFNAADKTRRATAPRKQKEDPQVSSADKARCVKTMTKKRQNGDFNVAGKTRRAKALNLKGKSDQLILELVKCNYDFIHKIF